jgi:hypothetical protein
MATQMNVSGLARRGPTPYATSEHHSDATLARLRHRISRLRRRDESPVSARTTAKQCVRATRPSSRTLRATVLHGEASPTDSANDPAVQEACFDGWRIIRTQIWLSRGYGLPAASLQPARRRRRRDSAAAGAIPPRARARRCRLPGYILAGVAAHTNAPQRVRLILYILVRPHLHLHVTLSPLIPLESPLVMSTLRAHNVVSLHCRAIAGPFRWGFRERLWRRVLPLETTSRAARRYACGT